MAGCSQVFPFLSGTDESPPVQIITGTDENHTIITEPLREIRPEPTEHDARLSVRFSGEMVLGVEGGLLFLEATDPAGTVVFDATIATEGGTVGLPSGDYSLLAYYRSCDGNCGLLDEPSSFCSADATLAPDGVYRLSVDMTAETCTFRDQT